MSHTWLITGASSGLGTSMALAALKAGHKVVAGARNPAKAKQDCPEVEKLGGVWLQLDVTASDVDQVVSKAVKEHNVNVLINNAGYAERGVLEGHSLEEMKRQFDTNLFGALAVTKAALPGFRERKSSNIVFISSTAGMRGVPGYSLYCASKWALEGAAEALSKEVASFNVRVLIVQPGAFRTNFQEAAGNHGSDVPAAYKDTAAEDIMKKLRSAHGKQPGDPDKAAIAILEAITGNGTGKDSGSTLRLPLGKDAVEAFGAKGDGCKEVVSKVGYIGESAVF